MGCGTQPTSGCRATRRLPLACGQPLCSCPGLFGGLWSLRRWAWMLPVSGWNVDTGMGLQRAYESPYVSAKALVIASPLLLLLAVRPLVERTPKRPSWWWLAAPVLALILVARVVDSSWEALRYGKVGSSSHLLELRALRPLLGNRRTLVLDDDDFIPWELAGAHVTVADLAVSHRWLSDLKRCPSNTLRWISIALRRQS